MLTKIEKDFREGVNYMVTDSGKYIGCMVNHSLICQANSLEELGTRLGIMFKMYVEMLAETANLKEPFVFIEKEDINEV